MHIYIHLVYLAFHTDLSPKHLNIGVKASLDKIFLCSFICIYQITKAIKYFFHEYIGQLCVFFWELYIIVKILSIMLNEYGISRYIWFLIASIFYIIYSDQFHLINLHPNSSNLPSHITPCLAFSLSL